MKNMRMSRRDKMNNKAKINWDSFVSGESELECESIEDAETLLRVCVEHDVDCNYVKPDDWISERYWYVKDNSLETTAYQLESDDICECWTVKDYIENHTYYEEEKENKNMGLDCSMIRHVRVPHEQFVAIKNKAECLIVEDKDKGGCVCFEMGKNISDEEIDKHIDDMKKEIKELRELLDNMKN